MEAEERCMLEAIQSLESNKRAVQQELENAVQRMKKLEEERWHLEDSLSEANAKLKQTCLDKREAQDQQEEMHKRMKLLERELSRERASSERLNGMLQAKIEESHDKSEHITQLESEQTRVMDEMLAWRDECESAKLRLKEIQSKLNMKDERIKELEYKLEKLEEDLNQRDTSIREEEARTSKELHEKEEAHLEG
eukprot:747306-Hanusia_phi.AAC.5